MIRVDTSAIKATLMHDKLYSPKQYTLKLKDLLPAIIRQRIEAKKVWLTEQIRTIKKPPQKVHQYVTQIKALDYIDNNYSDVKEYIELNSTVYQIKYKTMTQNHFLRLQLKEKFSLQF